MLPPNLAPIQEPARLRPRPHQNEVPAARIVATLVRTPVIHGLVDRRVCLLRYLTPPGNHQVTRAVRYAVAGDGNLIVRIDGTIGERWWSVFATPHPVQVYRRWLQYHGYGHALTHGQYGWRQAYRAYARRYPGIALDDADIFVVLTLTADAAERPRIPARAVVSP